MNNPPNVAACQVPDVREDSDAALDWIEKYANLAAAKGADLICFPECFLQGYLLEEKSARRNAIDLTSPAFDEILRRLARVEPALVFGMIETDAESLFNTAVVIDRGQLIGRYRKTNLLKSERVFQPGSSYPAFEMRGLRFGINICADTQCMAGAGAIAAQGAKLIVCPANNMMAREAAEKWKDRHNECRAQRARETGLWLVSSDVTGCRGDSVAMGPTCVIDPTGRIVAQVPMMEVGMVVAEIL